MTRKEELEQRAEDLASGPVSPYEVYVALAKVEWEAWEKAITILDGGRFLADSSMERIWADNVIKVLRTQQQELA